MEEITHKQNSMMCLSLHHAFSNSTSTSFCLLPQGSNTVALHIPLYKPGSQVLQSLSNSDRVHHNKMTKLSLDQGKVPLLS